MIQKIDIKELWSTWNVVLILAFVKLLIHFIFNTNYGFHRDEFLYLALGEHLGWGYMEVPPLIAVFGKLALILGGDLFIVRLFPTLIGFITVLLIGLMVKEFGGKKWAQTIACLAFILSPAFLRTNTLFQPVSFNQLCWFLSAVLIVKLIKTQNLRFWYSIGIVAGLGILTKYSIGFFYAAFLFGLLLTPNRKWLKTKYPYIAFGIALVIALPNLVWQIQHNLPIVSHMKELSQSQLQNVQVSGFMLSQFLMHNAGLLVWFPGLIYLLFSPKIAAYRILGWIYLFIILLLLLLSGKGYYSLGAYFMLMAAGGVAIENFLQYKPVSMKYALVSLLIILAIPMVPYGMPVLPVDKMRQYCAFMKDKFNLEGPLRWEDGKLYPLPQDYADMHGWEEIAIKVSKIYHNLTPEEQKSCLIYGGSYSHTDSINYYRLKYNLPEVYSFHGSHIMWAPDSLKFDRQIMIDDVIQISSGWFENMEMVDRVQNPYAREPGYIYYRSNPKIDLASKWTELVKENKKAYNF